MMLLSRESLPLMYTENTESSLEVEVLSLLFSVSTTTWKDLTSRSPSMASS